MHKKKNSQLLVVLSMVIMAIIALHLSKSNTNRLGIDKRLFQLGNQQEITDVFLYSEAENIHFKYSNNNWVLNDSLLMDQSMRDVFFSVLSRIEIRKPVPSALRDSLARLIVENGVHTKITFGEEVIKDYWLYGNSNLEISWAMDAKDQVPLQVHIPGYQSFIAGIYSIPGIEWRSRFIFKSNFALISKIEIVYPAASESLMLHYDNGFFSIPNIDADSTKVAELLDQLAYLQADEFIDPVNAKAMKDGLSRNDDFYANLILTKSGGEEESIRFYIIGENDKYIMGEKDDGTLCRFNYNRIKSIFKRPSDFD